MANRILGVGMMLTVVSALGCGGGEPAAPPATAAAPAAPVAKTVAERAQWYQDCWAMFNNKAWDKFQNCYAENAVGEQVDSAAGIAKGRAAIVKSTQDMIASFPDARGDLRLVLAHGPHTVGVALWHGTNTGPLPSPDGKSIPATNKPIGFLMAHMVETDPAGQHAVRDAGYIDEGTMMAQLGLVKAPARPVAASTPGAPTVVIARNDPSEAKNVDLVNTMLASFNSRDTKAIEAVTADSYVLHEIARPTDLDKKASFAATAELFKGFADAKVTTTEVWGAGDYVVAMGTLSGTNTGDVPSMGIKKTGKAVQVKFLEIFRIQDGKVVEDWLFYNGAAFATQLGM